MLVLHAASELPPTPEGLAWLHSTNYHVSAQPEIGNSEVVLRLGQLHVLQSDGRSVRRHHHRSTSTEQTEVQYKTPSTQTTIIKELGTEVCLPVPTCACLCLPVPALTACTCMNAGGATATSGICLAGPQPCKVGGENSWAGAKAHIARSQHGVSLGGIIVHGLAILPCKQHVCINDLSKIHTT